MLIIQDRKRLAEIFEKMDTDKILEDMLATRKEWQQDKREYDGTTVKYHWLTVRYKIALLTIVGREFE